MGSSGSITVAAGQIAARTMGEADATLASIGAAITTASEGGVELLVLPECAYPAYLLGSVESYRTGGHMGGEAFVNWLAERAARYRLHIVSGFVEDRGDRLCNAAVFIDDHGREIGRARKRFLWGLDHDWYAVGDEIRAFDSRLGRVGIVICAETRCPEILATLAADGAELIAMPTCWINTAPVPGEYANPQVEFLIEARAREFGLPFVCADKSGVEWGGVGYVGMSRIVLADGSLAAEAPPEGEMVIRSQIELAPSPWRFDHSEVRSRLLGDSPPVRPPADDLRPFSIAAIPGAAASQLLDLDGPLLHHLRMNRPDILLARPADPKAAQYLARQAADLGIELAIPPQTGETIVFAAGKAAGFSGSAARSFVLPRTKVLDGAAMLVFWDEPADVPLLRARAMENRVFVAAVTGRFALVVAPDGEILSYCMVDNLLPPLTRIFFNLATDKLVAPQTDLLDERHPALYRF